MVRLTQSGSGTVSWTAVSSNPWITITPASGIGPATLSIGIQRDPLPSGLKSGTGTISFVFTGTTSMPGPIAVTVVLSPSTVETLGVIDTPLEDSTGVVGAVPFTGWALDTFEVVGVTICRAATAGETAHIDTRCGGAAQMYRRRRDVRRRRAAGRAGGVSGVSAKQPRGVGLHGADQHAAESG